MSITFFPIPLPYNQFQWGYQEVDWAFSLSLTLVKTIARIQVTMVVLFSLRER
jgi:hypothetical protein